MEAASIYEVSAAKRKVKKEQRAWKYLRELCSLNSGDMNRLAVIDGNREYTYGQMFREWERYASVFTSLGMTEEHNTRAGVLGSTCAEVIFSFYGLNMVGAQVSLVASWSAFNFSRIEETILQEKLTDFIVTDDLAQPDLVRELLARRRELGLRHVIVLHVSMAGAAAIPVMTAAQEAKHASMKALFRPICMETLLRSFGRRPVRYSRQETDETAFIIHTTGTTSGTGKPVPMSDGALNAVAESFMNLKDISLPYDHLVTATMLDLSNSYGIINQIHLSLAMGATVVAIPLGFLNPWFYKAISACRISFLFSASFMFERWMKMPKGTDFDFSSLEFVALGGTAVSTEDKKRYHEFIEAHGGKNVSILNGYGLSELGGACCLSSPDLDDASIGYALPGFTVRLYDEDSGRYISPGRKGGEGVLYLSSPSMATPKLDGKDVIKVEIIDRKPYVCTNDLVHMDPDGRITYLGRAHRFFMREEGRKYESGKVEAEFSQLEEIENCVIVPVYYKIQHDTVPMLCVKTMDGADEPKDVILKALRRVFIEEKLLPENDIPSRVMLVEEFPRNTNGKIDLHQLSQGQVSDDVFAVEPVRAQDQLSDFSLTPFKDESGDVVEQVIDGISADIRSNAPGSKLVRNLKTGKRPKGSSNMLYDQFNIMSHMNQQMMNNMSGMMSQWFPMAGSLTDLWTGFWTGQLMPFSQVSELQSLKELMPGLPFTMDLPKPPMPFLPMPGWPLWGWPGQQQEEEE